MVHGFDRLLPTLVFEDALRVHPGTIGFRLCAEYLPFAIPLAVVRNDSVVDHAELSFGDGARGVTSLTVFLVAPDRGPAHVRPIKCPCRVHPSVDVHEQR